MRVVDAFLSLPWILKMLLMIVTFGAGHPMLISRTSGAAVAITQPAARRITSGSAPKICTPTGRVSRRRSVRS